MTTRPKYLRAELVDDTTVKLRWRVDDLAAVMATYDECKIETADAQGGSYTPLLETVALDADTHEYSYTDASGSADTWYRVFFHKDPDVASDPSVAVKGNGGGRYLTITAVRTAGVTESEHDDAHVLEVIRDVERDVFGHTRRVFYPQSKTLRVDGSGDRLLLLREEIIQVDEIEVVGVDYPTTPATTIEVGNTTVYNRHLTEGMVDPDDRESPKLARPFGAVWPTGRQNIQLTGWFGCTELGWDEEPGETAVGSQLPVNRGEAPRDLLKAMIRMVVRGLPLQADVDDVTDMENMGRVTKWKTRYEEVTYASAGAHGRPVGQITGDEVVDRALARWSRPARGAMV
jgi:hypothetical protein